MDPQPTTSSQSLSPRKKRPRIALSVTEKVMIQNVYKHVFEEKAASLLPIETPEKKRIQSILIDRQDIILWRQRYLRKIKEYRKEGGYIYYQDETWINEGHAPKKAWIDQTVLSSRQAFLDDLTTGIKQPSGKGKRLIIGHIGGEEEFWFRGILPKLKPYSVVVMDNAPYHSRKLESLPTMSWIKPKIQEWLTSKNISFEATMVKATLIDIVRQHKQEHYDKYVVDEMAAQHGIIVLCLPPYHCELNPIELVWAQAKGYVARNNKTFKMTEVKKHFEEGLQHITPEKWSSCVSHIIKEEDKIHGLDHMIDNVSDRFIINVTESDSDDFLSDDE
ncbi:uncharacterized protein LOC131840870 [Achroia grisella]|uniref:uncharacterized protein LOC131840870 n=1 Tax=Achroia grisella TaxID=688607 RepID=UPI0027D2A6D5|nr:uncharacterized protein LOC131840870 [Achroia grisella]